MAKERLNLTGVYSSTISKKKKKAVQDVQEIDIPVIEEKKVIIPGYGHTQGNKSGEKLKRINVQFTPENHIFLQAVAKKNGLTISKYMNYFLNDLMSNAQDVQDVVEGYKIQNKQNKRINMGFTTEIYEWVIKESAINNVSPSSFLNQLIERNKN